MTVSLKQVTFVFVAKKLTALSDIFFNFLKLCTWLFKLFMRTNYYNVRTNTIFNVATYFILSWIRLSLKSKRKLLILILIAYTRGDGYNKTVQIGSLARTFIAGTHKIECRCKLRPKLMPQVPQHSCACLFQKWLFAYNDKHVFR